MPNRGLEEMDDDEEDTSKKRKRGGRKKQVIVPSLDESGYCPFSTNESLVAVDLHVSFIKSTHPGTSSPASL